MRMRAAGRGTAMYRYIAWAEPAHALLPARLPALRRSTIVRPAHASAAYRRGNARRVLASAFGLHVRSACPHPDPPPQAGEGRGGGRPATGVDSIGTAGVVTGL